jgi:hypothetical protein
VKPIDAVHNVDIFILHDLAVHGHAAGVDIDMAINEGYF